MATDAALLFLTAASVGFLHTLLGPDHYLPFIFMSRALGWSRRRTLAVTLLCGLGHVFASIALGTLGLACGAVLTRLEVIESARGQLAAWLMIALGLVYAVWGLRRAQRQRPHVHVHAHAEGVIHRHEHVHAAEHVHVHAPVSAGLDAGVPRLAAATPWVLFTIFVFGPCEALIPLLMYPMAQHGFLGVVGVTAVFAAATLATMSAAVLAGHATLDRLRLTRLERYTHAVAGAAIACCGLAIQFLGL